MAARVNTRFILGLATVLAIGAAIVGVLYVLNVRGDATRNFRRGMTALETGDYEQARDQLGRAVHKDPGNTEYLAQLETALLNIVPDTADEAVNHYDEYLSYLRHAALHRPNEVAAHLRLLEELHSSGRRSDSRRYWDHMLSAAGDMLRQLPESDLDRLQAHTYSARATFQLGLIRTPEEIEQAVVEMEKVVAARPQDDLAHAVLIQGQMLLAEKLERLSVPTAFEAQRERLRDAVSAAVQAVPQGPETARAQLQFVCWERQRGQATDADVLEAEQRLSGLMDSETDPALLYEAALTLADSAKLLPQAIDLLEPYVRRHPESVDHQMVLSRLYYFQANVDEAERTARELLDAKTLTVSYDSQLQFSQRAEAAAMLANIAFRRWEEAPSDAKGAHIASMQEARERLAKLVTDPENNVLVMAVDGKLAFANADHQVAAAKFERYISQSEAVPADVLVLDAFALEHIGQLGRAHERLSDALRLAPTHGPWLAERARMELAMGRLEAASASIAAIPDSARSYERIRQIIELVQLRAASPGSTADDPIQAAIVQANAALVANEIDNARAALSAPLQLHPNDIILIQAMAQLEFRAGEHEKALEYVQRGLELSPQNVMLLQIQALANHDDPIAAIVAFHQSVISDEAGQALVIAADLDALAQQQRQGARALEAQRKPAEAQSASELAVRAAAESDTWMAKATALMPDRPELLEVAFNRAVRAQDWTAADEIVTRARALNADQANGLIYRGRYEIARGNFDQAVQSLEAATDLTGYSASAWKSLGFAYHSLGSVGQAERAYEQAYRNNPADLDVARAYTGLLRMRGDEAGALTVLKNVYKLAPQDRSIRDAYLDAELATGNTLLVLRERLALHRANPDDRPNAARLARMFIEIEPRRELMLDDENRERFPSQIWARMTAAQRQAALDQAKRQWTEYSNRIVNELEEGAENPTEVVILRATLLREQGKIAEGETVIRQHLATVTDPEKRVPVLIELSKYQSAANHYSEAIATLEEAVKIQDPARRGPEATLGVLLMQLARFEQALAHLENVYAATSNLGTAHQIVECLIKLKRFDEAEKRLAALAKDGKPNGMSVMLEATIADARGDDLFEAGNVAAAEREYATYRDTLARAESVDPTNPGPRLLLARSLLKEYQRTKRPTLLDDALLALSRADRLRPDSPEISFVRVSVLRQKGDIAGAMTELQRVLSRNPTHAGAQRELIELHLARGETTEAMARVDEAIATNPTFALWHELKGDLLRSVQQDDRAAAASYARAYELVPSLSTLMKVLDVEFSIEPPGCAKVIALIEARRDDLSEPALRELYARALACEGRRDEALEQLRLAYARRQELVKDGTAPAADIATWFTMLPDVFVSADAGEIERFVLEQTGAKPGPHDLRGLAKVWYTVDKAGGLSRAIELQRQAAAAVERAEAVERVAVEMELGGFLVMNLAFAEAAQRFERALAIDPNNSVALNNLAYITAEELDDPSKALPLAERAVQLAPGDPSVLDTLGWVHHLLGSEEKARGYLSESLNIRPDPTTHIHIATVLAALKQSAEAIRHLDLAARLLDETDRKNPDPETRRKLDALRDDIQKAGANAGAPQPE